MKQKYDWNVNWLDQDIVISRGLGCSKERVRQRRYELGKAQSPNYCKHNIDNINNLLKLSTENMSLDEISIKTGYTKSTLSRILKENGKEYTVVDHRKNRIYNWDNVNWDESNKAIALQLGVKNVAVVYHHRRRLFKNVVGARKDINLVNSGDSKYRENKCLQ